MKTVRTRIPPSPTGQDIHIGNLYTALMNWAYAKKNKGQFIIRIEDTDRERFVEGSEGRILASLKAYGLQYDEGPDIGGPHAPYRQSERLPLYKKYAEELIAKNAAYYCFCTKERLDEIRKAQIAEKKVPRYDKHCLHTVKDAQDRVKNGEKYVIRLNVQPDKKVWFDDVVRGRIEFESNQIDDQVLLKSDGYPTYHLGVVVDDHLMGVTHVMRAEEWIPSTPKHVILYEAFGWELPVFAHLSILRNPDRSKLSKRKNPVWAMWYLENGYLPEAVLNFLVLMGWSHPEQKEIFPLDEFVRLFDITDLKAVGPIFDMTKLTWMNQQYIMKMSDEELFERLKKFYSDVILSEAKDLKPEDKKILRLSPQNDSVIKQLLPLVRERLQTLKDFEVLAGHFFAEPEISLRNEAEKTVAKELSERLEKITGWDKDTIFATFKEVMTAYSVRMPVLYYVLTGNERGLPLPESIAILGKEKTLSRLNHLLQ